jgi:DNA-binding response OmpR family regulator
VKVLCVDDDEDFLALVATTLRAHGREVETASSGEAALALLRAQPVSIVLSDWQMPGLDGIDLCRTIRALPMSRYVYFILLTVRRRDLATYADAVSAGVDDFLTKPLEPRELMLRLLVAERILGHMRQLGQLRRLVPICSKCQKIRDDFDFWHRIETYVHRTFGASFTHGLCPDCARDTLSPAPPAP